MNGVSYSHIHPQEFPSLREIISSPLPAPGNLEVRYQAELERLQALSRQERRQLRARWRMNLASIALMLAMGGSLLLSRPARAASIDVDGSTCTLADAIASANTDSATGGCNKGDGADTLNLQYDVDLSSVLTAINSQMTIEGGGHTIQRTGGSNFHVLTVLPAGNLTLKQAVISGGSGQYAGGILSEGILTVESSTISSNQSYYNGGGITNYGTLTLQSSTISGNSAGFYGGGIHNNVGAYLTVVDSTLSNNDCEKSGGGIVNYGYAGIYTSTISGNTAGVYGGGIANYGTGLLTIENSTISGNTASGLIGGGIINLKKVDSPSTSLLNSTITDNSAKYGGGVYNGTDGTVTVQNSIVAEQSYGLDCYGIGGITSYGYNIESGTSCGFTAGGDRQSMSSANLKLDTLGDNGGPTYTHALLSGSYAIDWIPDEESYCDGGVSTDQRGAVRAGGTSTTGGPYCDVGAFEYASAEIPTVITIQSVASAVAEKPILAVGSSIFASLAVAGSWWLHKKRLPG